MDISLRPARWVVSHLPPHSLPALKPHGLLQYTHAHESAHPALSCRLVGHFALTARLSRRFRPANGHTCVPSPCARFVPGTPPRFAPRTPAPPLQAGGT